MSVGTTSARRPCDADHLGHLLQPPLGAADEHQVGAHLGGLLAERAAQPGADAGEHDDLVLQQLAVSAHVVASVTRSSFGRCRRCRAAIRAAYSVGGDRVGEVRQHGRAASANVTTSTVGPSVAVEVALEPLPAQHHRAGAVAGGLQPVGDPGVALARRRSAASRRGRRRDWALVSEVWWCLVVGGGVPVASRSGSPGRRSRRTPAPSRPSPRRRRARSGRSRRTATPARRASTAARSGC